MLGWDKALLRWHQALFLEIVLCDLDPAIGDLTPPCVVLHCTRLTFKTTCPARARAALLRRLDQTYRSEAPGPGGCSPHRAGGRAVVPGRGRSSARRRSPPIDASE